MRRDSEHCAGRVPHGLLAVLGRIVANAGADAVGDDLPDGDGDGEIEGRV